MSYRRAPRHQNGQLEVRSDGKGKYYSGRYTIYVKNGAGKEVRKQPRPFLGYCSEINESEAFNRLQLLINQSQTKSPKDMEEANQQFWKITQVQAGDRLQQLIRESQTETKTGNDLLDFFTVPELK